jgi:two-component system nitrate/nitrite response regulator NarL
MAARVAVVTQQPLLREGIVQALRSRRLFELAGLFGAEASASEIDSFLPDVAVVDLDLPVPDVCLLVAELTMLSAVRVLALSPCLEPTAAVGPLTAGASGFLCKDEVDGLGLAAAVGELASGGTVVSAAAHRAFTAGLRRESEPARALSRRELEILDLAAQGRSAVEIGRDLNVSASTVKTHLQRLYDKLGVSHRGAAIAEGVRRQLIS